MNASVSASTPLARVARPLVVAALLVAAALVATSHLAAEVTSPHASSSALPGDQHPDEGEAGVATQTLPVPARPLGEVDGVLTEGASPFATTPGVANLDADLLRALRAAATDAAEEGVTLVVNSGWRSPEHQEQLLRDAVREHGSHEEAARWVAPADRSAHVSGDAVDVGPARAATWLAERGAAYGLCRTYENEPWHFELRPSAVGGRCPRRYADPTEDPALQP